MSANIFFLYGTTVIIWGTTWRAIKFQLGSVDPMVSVLYRFIAAALTLVVYCKLRGLNMRFRPQGSYLYGAAGSGVVLR